jgi:hypothetical protein
MAHFAEIDKNNIVIRTIVIGNDFVEANGGELSIQAEQAVKDVFKNSKEGVAWKQTSYNRNFRRYFAGPRFIYIPERDEFIPPKPFPSWNLYINASDFEIYKAPVIYPSIIKNEQGIPYFIYWHEEFQKWLGIINNDSSVVFEWNPNTLSWSTLSN